MAEKQETGQSWPANHKAIDKEGREIRVGDVIIDTGADEDGGRVLAVYGGLVIRRDDSVVDGYSAQSARDCKLIARAGEASETVAPAAPSIADAQELIRELHRLEWQLDSRLEWQAVEDGDYLLEDARKGIDAAAAAALKWIGQALFEEVAHNEMATATPVETRGAA